MSSLHKFSRLRKPRFDRRPHLEDLEARTLLSSVPTRNTPGIVQVGLGTYTENFPDQSTYPEYLGPTVMNYHPPTSIYLSGEGSSPSLVFPSITPGSPYLDNPDPTQNLPVATSEWWSSLMFRRGIEQSAPFTAMQPHPLSLLPRTDGLGIAYVDRATIGLVGPNDPRAPGPQYIQYQYPQTAAGNGTLLDDLTVGLDTLKNRDASKVTVYNYSDWTVTADWNGQMRSTAGEGLPFVTFEFPTGGTAQIKFDPSQPATLVQNFQNGAVLVKVGTRFYGLFAPTSAANSWDTTSATLYTVNGLTAANGYLSVALMPDGFNPATDLGTTFALFRQHAYNFVTDAKATYTFNEATGSLVTTLALTTVFKDNANDPSLDKTSTLQALYPHQWLALSSGSVTNLSYTSSRGNLRILSSGPAGNTFQTTLQYQGVLPFLPDIAGGVTYHQTLWEQQLLPYLQIRSTPNQLADALDLSSLIRGGDVYALGQSMLGAIQLVPILDQVAQSLQTSQDPKVIAEGQLAATYAVSVLQIVKDEMGAWLSATDDDRVKFLYYDRNFDALLATPGAYESSDGVNDQHLGFGYFVKTAAIIAQYDPAWAEPTAMGGMIEMIIKEVANPVLDARGELLPRLRNFDPYAGHSWADGSANSNNGNNQESSSEALNFASGLIQWGEVTGNTALRDLGVYLFTTESNSVKYYYFNQQNDQNPASQVSQGYSRPQISILESVGGEYQTFFDTTPAVLQTIQFVPYTGGSFYLSDLGTFRDATGQPVVDTTYNEVNFQAGKGTPASNPLNVYQNPLYMYRALQSQAQAQASLAYLFNSTTGQPNYLPFDGAPGTTYGGNNGVDNPAFDFHWLNVLSSYGRPDRTITANTTLYSVFVADNGTTHTYTAYNPGSQPLAVTFSDGYILNVPARSLKTSAGLTTGAPADQGLATLTPDRGIVAAPNRLFLQGGNAANPAAGSFGIGQTGAYESRLTIPGANNGAVTAGLQARIPPNAQAVRFTTTGINGTYDPTVPPTAPLRFEIWLDGGVVPEEVLNSQVGLLFEIFNNGGTGTTPDYFLRYADFALPASSPQGIITGYVVPYEETYGGGVVDFSGKSAGGNIPKPPDLVNATIRLTLYASLGLTPVTVRVDAAAPQSRLSYVDIPYVITSTSPTVSVSSPSAGSVAGQPTNFTATLTQVGSAPYTGQIQFFDGQTPIGPLLTPGSPTTNGSITTATASLTGFSGLAAGTHQISARYFTPSIISLAQPLSGGTGQIVKILGTNLTGASAVTFGGTSAASFTVDSATQITAIVGSGGNGAIEVTTPAGKITSSSSFSYTSAAQAPSLTDYSPASAGPGAAITLTGTGFTGATSVKVGGVAVQSFQITSATQISIILSNTSASGPIEITTPGGIASSANLADSTKRRFLIGGSGPTINDLSTLSGSTGQAVVISGQLFTGVTQVTFGGVPAQSFTLDFPTQITAIVAGGSGPVVVTTPNGTSTSYQLFAFGPSGSFLINSSAIDYTVIAASRQAPSVVASASYPRVPYASTQSTLTFSASVAGPASNSATPTGSVTFLVNGQALATVAVGADGNASYTPDKPLLPGNYQLTALYSGDTTYAPTTSAAYAHIVTRINPLIEYVDAVSNPSVGGAVILRAKLTSLYPANGYAPNGRLDFYDGTTFLGEGSPTFDPGVFTFTANFTADPTALTYRNIRVEYRGDAYYYPDVFPNCGYPLAIQPATQTQGLATETTISAMVNDPTTAKAVVGQVVFFNASVAPLNPPPGWVGYITGKVSFQYQTPAAPNTWVPMDANPEFLLLYYNGRTNLDQTQLEQLPSFRPTAAGTYRIRALYDSEIDFAGNPNPQFLNSEGDFTLEVEPSTATGLYPTLISLSSVQSPGLPADTTLLDETIQLVATVTSPNAWLQGPFAGQVTADGSQVGNVQFYRNGSKYALIPITPDGQAVLQVASEPPGKTRWTAAYVPNPAFVQFGPSPMSATVSHVVQTSSPSALSVVVTPPAPPLLAGQPITVRVSVKGQSALGLGIPSGNVVFTIQGSKSDFGGTVALDATGAAVFTSAALPADTYMLSAVYNADGSDPYFPSKSPQNSSATVSLLVSDPNQAPTVTAPAALALALDGLHVFSSLSGTAIRVGDSDAGSMPVSLTLSATHGLITLARRVGLGFIVGDARPATRLTVTGTLADLNAALEGLRFQAQPGYRGVASLSILVNDLGNRGYGGSREVQQHVALLIRGPVLAPLPDINVPEGDTMRVTLSASDPQAPGARLNYTLAAGAPQGASIDASTGLIQWKAPAANLVATFTVIVRDDDLPTAQASQTFNVRTVNVAPVVSLVNTVTAERGKPLRLSGSFADAGRQSWTGTVDYGDGKGQRRIVLTPSKTFSLNQVYRKLGTYTITVRISDGLSVTNQTITVRVTPRARRPQPVPLVAKRVVTPKPQQVSAAKPR